MIKKEHIRKILNDSFDNIKDFSPNELCDFLIKAKIINSQKDFNYFILEGINNALEADDEFPIKYYSKDEEMSEEGRFVEPEESLTDEFIANNMN